MAVASTSLQELANGAGVLGFFLASGSLWLGFKNWRHTRGKDAREEQRTERNDLRELLFAVKFDLEKACKIIASGGDLPTEPPSIKQLQDAIPRYQRILEVPDEHDLFLLQSTLTMIVAWWSLVQGHISDAERGYPVPGDPQGRKRAATEADAKENFEETVVMIDRLVDKINKANRA